MVRVASSVQDRRGGRPPVPLPPEATAALADPSGIPRFGTHRMTAPDYRGYTKVYGAGAMRPPAGRS